MAVHFPFSGNASRVSIFFFYERHKLGPALQERYYQWWYDWARSMVMSDPGLKAAKGQEFSRFPYGQHSQADFHLRQGLWATALADLGDFIKGSLLPRLDPGALHKLEADHQAMLEALSADEAPSARPAPPEIGWFRHS